MSEEGFPSVATKAKKPAVKAAPAPRAVTKPVAEAAPAKATEPVAKASAPSPAKAAPVAKPAPIAKTVAEAEKAYAKAVEPVAKAAKPIVKAAEPMAKVAEPVVKAVEPVTKVAEAVAETTLAKVEETAASTAEIIEAVTSPAVDSDLISAGSSIAPAPQEEMMATVEAATDKAQAAFGEMNARFKSAFEKSTKYGEEIVDFAKGNVEALVASARVAAKGGETLGADMTEYGKKSYESAMALFRSLASVKSPTELFQLQSDYAKSAFDAAVAEASATSEKVLKLAGDVAQPLSTRYAVAAEKIKATAI